MLTFIQKRKKSPHFFCVACRIRRGINSLLNRNSRFLLSLISYQEVALVRWISTSGCHIHKTKATQKQSEPMRHASASLVLIDGKSIRCSNCTIPFHFTSGFSSECTFFVYSIRVTEEKMRRERYFKTNKKKNTAKQLPWIKQA